MKRIQPNLPNGDALPCSYVALYCAATDLTYPVGTWSLPKVDKVGYCKLSDMTASLRSTFSSVRYCYVNPAFRVTLSEFANKHRNEKYIVCVQGHFVYFNGKDYYSYFDNSSDKVVAVWRIS